MVFVMAFYFLCLPDPIPLDATPETVVVESGDVVDVSSLFLDRDLIRECPNLLNGKFDHNHSGFSVFLYLAIFDKLSAFSSEIDFLFPLIVSCVENVNP